ncbi:hypothetical protein K438DRAFT_1771609 [Mycena galopus ATCC 62051]|nr:hypothetical protein K438DRAFT_1771609 [Mycena galopus ATCC 62051]
MGKEACFGQEIGCCCRQLDSCTGNCENKMSTERGRVWAALRQDARLTLGVAGQPQTKSEWPISSHRKFMGVLAFPSPVAQLLQLCSNAHPANRTRISAVVGRSRLILAWAILERTARRAEAIRPSSRSPPIVHICCSNDRPSQDQDKKTSFSPVFLAQQVIGAICYLGSFHSETAASAFCLATFTPGPERTVPLFSTSDVCFAPHPYPSSHALVQRGGRRREATAWTVSALRLDLHLIAILPSPSPSLARASALTMPPATITPMEALFLCFAAHLSRRTGENTAKEPEEWNALYTSARSEWSVHAPRAAPVDIVVESEVERWEWMWRLAHTDWSAHTSPPASIVISESEAEYWKNVHSDLKPPAPGRGDDDDDELTSTKSVDSSAFGVAATRLLSSLSSPSMSRPLSVHDERQGLGQAVVDATPARALFAAGGSTSDKERDEERELAVDLVPVRASASAVSLEVDDANKALFAASGRPFLGHHQRRRGLHARDPIDVASRRSRPRKQQEQKAVGARARRHAHARIGLQPLLHHCEPGPLRRRRVVCSWAITTVAEDVRGRGRSKRKSSDEDGGDKQRVRASIIAGGEGTDKAKGKRRVIDVDIAPVLDLSAAADSTFVLKGITTAEASANASTRGHSNATDEATDSGSTSVRVLRTRTKTCSGALSIFSAAARKTEGGEEDEALLDGMNRIKGKNSGRGNTNTSRSLPEMSAAPLDGAVYYPLLDGLTLLALEIFPACPSRAWICIMRPYLETTLLAGLNVVFAWRADLDIVERTSYFLPNPFRPPRRGQSLPWFPGANDCSRYTAIPGVFGI